MRDPGWNIPDLVGSDSTSGPARESEWSALALRILRARGWMDAGGRVDPAWDERDPDYADPRLLPDMDRAVTRVVEALQSRQRIVVHGDYDADGISGTALLTSGLRALGADAEPFVPDRMKDGYGVAMRLVERAGEANVGVLITVDTGTSAHEALTRAQQLGIDVVVCDHHLLEAEPAPAFALINPQREDSAYPHRDLCGCAVAWKLLCAIHAALGRPEPAEQLDLVALATVADQVPLRGENRGLVRRGLRQMREGPRPGIAALLELCRLRGVDFDEGDLAFQIAPRINAAGRVESPRTALELLMTADGGTARRLAARCDDLNRRRKSVQQRVSAGARVLAQRAMERALAPAGLVLADRAWEFGVVGISAAQIAASFQRPTVLLAIDGEVARGSARSAQGIDLKGALDGCADLLLRHGGHAAAAGLLIQTDQIDEFRVRFDAVIREMNPESGESGPRIDARAELAEIDSDLVYFLRKLGPFGMENPEPRLVSTGLMVESARRVGTDHLRLRLRCPAAESAREFIGFSMADEFELESAGAARVDVIYSVGYREGTPFDPWQLKLHAIRAHSPREAADERL